ncbi:uncharacterized protein LOC125551540 [Triticum urartu]|uniref:uncharacterized protein LOC125551540 n=1 Tax=Triticum urartu TaxID=4572 RepID=UPI002043EC01|nr:uncharacterized protein LOC125551540 [Triticum urartu]
MSLPAAPALNHPASEPCPTTPRHAPPHSDHPLELRRPGPTPEPWRQWRRLDKVPDLEVPEVTGCGSAGFGSPLGCRRRERIHLHPATSEGELQEVATVPWIQSRWTALVAGSNCPPATPTLVPSSSRPSSPSMARVSSRQCCGDNVHKVAASANFCLAAAWSRLAAAIAAHCHFPARCTHAPNIHPSLGEISM